MEVEQQQQQQFENDNIEEDYYDTLLYVQNDMYKTKSNKLSPEVMAQLAHITAKIMQKRRHDRESKKRAKEESTPYPPGGPQRLRSAEQSAMLAGTGGLAGSEMSSPTKPKRIRPYYVKILTEVFSADCLNEVKKH